MKILSLFLAAVMLCCFNGCATTTNFSHQDSDSAQHLNTGYCALGGALVGAGVGAATRIKKPAKNMFIGAIAGAISGAVLCRVIEVQAQRIAIEAAQKNRKVVHKTDEGQKITATPLARQPGESCQEIVNEAWDTDGTHLGKVIRRVCPDGQGGWKAVN